MQTGLEVLQENAGQYAGGITLKRPRGNKEKPVKAVAPHSPL
jgi:hypothetical protein